MIAALSCNTRCPSALTSALSSKKNSGFSGESRFRSSSDLPAIESSDTGSGGTGIGSLTGCGGGGGPVGPPVAVGGGGIGRATAGCFFAHALIVNVISTARTINLSCLMRTSLEPCPWNIWNLLELLEPLLLRPMRSRVIAIAGDLPEIPAVPIDGEDLAATLARRHEGQMPAVRRPHRALVRAFAERDLPRLATGDVQDLDVEPGTGACRESDLVVRRRRPCGAIGIRLGRHPPQPGAVHVHDIYLRCAGSFRGEGDLRAGG